MTNIWNGNNLEGMTLIRKEWQKSGRNDSNTEEMTIMWKEWHNVFFWKKMFFSKTSFISCLPHYCHSFRITVIPSVLLSFLLDYCHSFRIIGIPSLLVSFLPNSVIPSELFRELQILTSPPILKLWNTQGYGYGFLMT